MAKFGTGLERYPSQQRNSYQNPQFYGYPYIDCRTNHRYFIAPLTTGDPDLSIYFAKDIATGICVGEALRAYPFILWGRLPLS